jgi:DNA-binding LacI/PurR family transcriptional regulator
MTISIKDIAKRAGVSPATVSRALHNHPRLSAKTTGAIQALAQEMGYVPSAVARSLVSSRSTTIGVAVNDFLNPFYVDLIANIENAVTGEDYHVFISSFHQNRERELSLMIAFLERRLAGIIVVGSIISHDYLTWPNRASMPIVLISCPAYPFSVSVDHFMGVRLAMEHLIGLGHRRIAYVTQGHQTETQNQRLRGYRTMLAEHDLPLDSQLIVTGDGNMTGGVKAAPQLLALPQRPTAILCYNDMTAIGVINRLQHEGYHVPNDFSVVGFDDLGLAACYSPALTTVRQPTRQLGQGAMHILNHLVAGQKEITPQILEPRLIVRHSTAPPNNE